MNNDTSNNKPQEQKKDTRKIKFEANKKIAEEKKEKEEKDTVNLNSLNTIQLVDELLNQYKIHYIDKINLNDNHNSKSALNENSEESTSW